MTDFTHPSPQGPLIAFGLFDQPVTMPELKAALDAEFSGSVGEHSLGGADSELPQTQVLAVDTQGVTILVAAVPAPVPNNEAVSACHPVWWQDTTRVERHTHHVIITAFRQPGEVVSRERALSEGAMLAAVATIILGLPGAVGLFYGSAGITFPVAPYRELVMKSLDEGRLPVESWSAVWLIPGEQTVSGYTLGLDAFGHADLVITDSAREPSEVFTMLVSLAAHLIASGDHLSPGSWVGPTEEERYAVSIGDSAAHSAPVLRIEY